jgi:hypothetical protein
MSDISTINLNFLKTIKFDEITSRLKITQNKEGKFVNYLTVTVSEKTGEILDIAKSAKIFKDVNILASPIAIKRESLTKESPCFKLELINQGDAQLPDGIREVVEESFSNFNKEKKSS